MKITLFKSEWETYIDADMSIDASWDEVSEILTEFHKKPVKEDTCMYNLWEFKSTDGTIHRCADDCVALHGLVIDYDQNLPLINAVEQFAGFECVVYTTFNHQLTGLDKYRVVVPFTKPMPIKEFDKKRNSMIEAFPGADRASFSRSQAIFLHSGPDESLGFAARMNGELLDWTVFEDEEVIEYEPVQRDNKDFDSEISAAYRTAVINSLKTCRGIRHLNSLSLAIVLKSCGASFSDYKTVVSVAGAADSCIHDAKNQQETWNAAEDDCRIRKEKRDKFIKTFGGKPVVVSRVNRIESKLEQMRGKLNARG